MRQKYFLFLFDVMYGFHLGGCLGFYDLEVVPLFARQSKVAGVAGGLFHYNLIFILLTAIYFLVRLQFM